MSKSVLLIYKNHSPGNLKLSFESAISFNTVIFIYHNDDEPCQLTVAAINEIFENSPHAADVPRKYLIEMIHYLREGYHKQRFLTIEESYPGAPGEHPQAAQIYPLLYQQLVEGLSPQALRGLSTTDLSNSHLPNHLGVQLLHGIKQDRKEMIFDLTEREIYACRRFDIS